MAARLPTGRKHGSARRASSFRPIPRPAGLRTLGAVNVTHRLAGLAETATTVALGLALSAVLAADVAVTDGKHGNWVFELAVGAVVGCAALLRGRNRLLAATAGP